MYENIVFTYLCKFVMSYDVCTMLIIRKQTLWLTTSDMMNVAMLDSYECMNLIWKL